MKKSTCDKNSRWIFLAMLFTLHCSLFISPARAQIGDYRNELAVGFNGGLTMSNIGFTPTIPQNWLMGKTMGFSVRYTGEKYFNSICAIVAELNYSQLGWKEDQLTENDEPVINYETGVSEQYSRKISYIQLPIFARMGWGRERRGFQFYFQVGPQLGYYLNESTEANFDLEKPNLMERVSPVVKQYEMPVENKLDYGIAGGLGLEFSNRHIGHFLLEGRYYYGLGNLYGNSKRDYFAISNFQVITVKLSYLFDIVRTKNPKIK